MIFLAHPYGCYSIGIDTRKGVCGQALAGGSGCPQFVKIWSIRTHSDCSDDFMILIKTPEEIQTMKEGGQILSKIIKEVASKVQPGVSTADLEDLAVKLMKEAGGRPAFLGYRPEGRAYPYPAALCVSINHEVVHAPSLPSRIIKDGDVVSIDTGFEYQGLFTDMAASVGVGKIKKDDAKLIAVTRDALKLMIKNIKAGVLLSDVGEKVQNFVERKGFNVVRTLVGHGVGRNIHEEPQVPNFYDPSATTALKEGMTLALEPMVVAGSHHVFEDKDKWTIKTVDRGKAAHFEVTVAVTKKGCDIITPLI